MLIGGWFGYPPGSGIDSFYEYLFKAYVLFGQRAYLDLYQRAAAAVRRYLKKGPWYVEADMHSGAATHLHFNSLQAFFPGLQAQAGALAEAADTQAAFFSIWARFRGLPERYVLATGTPHPTLAYYPLRPELAESAYFLYQATRHPKYLDVRHSVPRARSAELADSPECSHRVSDVLHCPDGTRHLLGA